MSSLTSRFDYYTATFEHLDELQVAQNLAIALRGTVTFTKGRNGYSRGWSIERENNSLTKVYGGSNRPGEVHIVTSSESCDEVVPVIRNLWPVHRVSRVDSAMDFKTDYDQLEKMAQKFAKDRGLAWHVLKGSDGGATFSIGSRNSERYLRIYKKTEQMRSLHPERSGEIPEGIIRAELEFKPSKKAAKAATAVLTPDDIWGLGKWTHDFAQEVLNLAPERTHLRFKKSSDWTRSLHYLGAQYAPMIARRLETHAPEDVMLEVLTALGIDGI